MAAPMRDLVLRGGALRDRRLALEMTQRELSARTKLAVSFIKYLENGRCQPSDVSLRTLCRVLDCAPEDITSPKPAETAAGSAA